jgi:hypothetical protein
MNGQLSVFERAVMEAALVGDHPVLESLREQLHYCSVRNRSYSGVGFFTEFTIDPGTPAAPTSRDSVHIGDVAASVNGLKHGAGFVVFVRGGYLDMLEGHSYDEPWPEQIEEYEIQYTSEGPRDVASLEL